VCNQGDRLQRHLRNGVLEIWKWSDLECFMTVVFWWVSWKRYSLKVIYDQFSYYNTLFSKLAFSPSLTLPVQKLVRVLHLELLDDISHAVHTLRHVVL
jgi:hypothetical protein